MKKKNPIQKSILWDITRRCNLNCTHCYNSDNIATLIDLDIKANHKIIIDSIIKLGINHIHLLGGEPLLASGLFELIEYAKRNEINVTINTNGTLLSSSVIKKLINLKVEQITISLDGATEQENDVIRGEGTFNLVTKNIRRAIDIANQKQSEILFQIATVITKQNIHSIYKMPRLLKSIGIKYLDVLKLYECGNATVNERILQISQEEYIEALGKLILESYRNGIFLQVDCKPKVLEVLGNKYGFKVELDSDFNKCLAANKILYMDCSGDIYPCGPVAHSIEDIELGNSLTANIFDKDLLERVSAFKDIIRHNLCLNTSVYDICTECNFASQCNGCAICYNDYDKLCKVACNLL